IEKAVEIWRIRSQEEVTRSLARKKKRRREKITAAERVNGDANMDADKDEEDDAATPQITDVFVPYTIIRPGGKVRSVDWISNRATRKLRLLTSLTNNMLEVYEIP